MAKTTTEDRLMLCPKCGKSVAEKARSCGSCGQTIDVDGDLTNTMRIPPGFMDVGAAAPTPQPGLFARIKKLFRR